MSTLAGSVLTCSGAPSSRRELDFYPTPPEVTYALMDFLKMPPSRIWEPACGKGHMSEVILAYGHQVHSSDIADTGYGVAGVDFLNAEAGQFDAIITNPPFNVSEEFIRKALKHSEIVCMLLKSQYWHASKRAVLFNSCRPRYVLPLTWRPDFLFDTRDSGKRAAPTMECCWTVWDKSNLPTEYHLLQKQKLPAPRGERE